jgi:hypothetical protein
MQRVEEGKWENLQEKDACKVEEGRNRKWGVGFRVSGWTIFRELWIGS